MWHRLFVLFLTVPPLYGAFVHPFVAPYLPYDQVPRYRMRVCLAAVDPKPACNFTIVNAINLNNMAVIPPVNYILLPECRVHKELMKLKRMYVEFENIWKDGLRIIGQDLVVRNPHEFWPELVQNDFMLQLPSLKQFESSIRWTDTKLQIEIRTNRCSPKLNLTPCKINHFPTRFPTTVLPPVVTKESTTASYDGANVVTTQRYDTTTVVNDKMTTIKSIFEADATTSSEILPTTGTSYMDPTTVAPTEMTTTVDEEVTTTESNVEKDEHIITTEIAEVTTSYPEANPTTVVSSQTSTKIDLELTTTESYGEDVVVTTVTEIPEMTTSYPETITTTVVSDEPVTVMDVETTTETNFEENVLATTEILEETTSHTETNPTNELSLESTESEDYDSEEDSKSEEIGNSDEPRGDMGAYGLPENPVFKRHVRNIRQEDEDEKARVFGDNGIAEPVKTNRKFFDLNRDFDVLTPVALDDTFFDKYVVKGVRQRRCYGAEEEAETTTVYSKTGDITTAFDVVETTTAKEEFRNTRTNSLTEATTVAGEDFGTSTMTDSTEFTPTSPSFRNDISAEITTFTEEDLETTTETDSITSTAPFFRNSVPDESTKRYTKGMPIVIDVGSRNTTRDANNKETEQIANESKVQPRFATVRGRFGLTEEKSTANTESNEKMDQKD